MKCTKIQIPVGREMVCAEVPEPVSVIRPQEIPGAADAGIEIERALANPIGSPRLCELARGKKSAAIVVNDITRPYPGGLMVEGLAKELHLAGLSDDRIFLVVAYGHHRFNTEEELREMFGEEVVRRFRIVHHDAMDADKLVTVGRTSAGIDVEINRDFAQAEVKILTGCITPHQLAGYSGGRKSVLPGISGVKTLKKHHSFPIRPETTSLGWLQGNPFHEQSLEAARIAGVDFILNSVDNYKKEVVRCVAGELNEAHLEGVKLCREIWGVHMPQKPDVVIVSPGGYPRDFDLHQSQKAVGCADKTQAKTLAKSVVTSSLTKAAIFGHDATWGRILCAMGYSGAEFDPEQVDIYFESAAGSLKIVENGVSTGYSEETATRILSQEKVTCIMDVKMGEAAATAWGCDLTFDYVKINADYRS